MLLAEREQAYRRRKRSLAFGVSAWITVKTGLCTSLGEAASVTASTKMHRDSTRIRTNFPRRRRSERPSTSVYPDPLSHIAALAMPRCFTGRRMTPDGRLLTNLPSGPCITPRKFRCSRRKLRSGRSHPGRPGGSQRSRCCSRPRWNSSRRTRCGWTATDRSYGTASTCNHLRSGPERYWAKRQASSRARGRTTTKCDFAWVLTKLLTMQWERVVFARRSGARPKHGRGG